MSSSKLLPGGFPEHSISSQKKENVIKTLIAKTFEQYGFVNIETPSVESIDVLTSKGGEEVSNQIYGLYGLAQGGDDLKKYALHFDLTVPLARYVIDHENEIKFPFKRYQIQKVWRGERQQKGRFKEFYQCDVDVIDENLNIYYDAEVIEVLFQTIQNIFLTLDLEKQLVVKLNNRKIYDYLFDKYTLTEEKRARVLSIIDAYYKYESKQKFESDLKQAMPQKHDLFLKDLNKLIEIFSQETSVGVDSTYEEIVSDILYVMKMLRSNGVSVVFDPYIVRGLDYYDGTVFETYILGHEEIGSVCSGGRYSNLVGSLREKCNKKGKNYGGVGGSIGLSRLLYVMGQEGLLQKAFSLVDAIIFNLDGDNDFEKMRHDIARNLRNVGIRVDHYIGKDKLQKQFAYAESKQIQYGIFVEKDDMEEGKVKIRNLLTREDYYVTIENISQFTLELVGNDSLG